LFGLGIAEWVTIIALVASVPLTLRVMARASAAYERKAAEREAQAEKSGDESPERRAEGN
jgi:hypothetical protein